MCSGSVQLSSKPKELNPLLNAVESAFKQLVKNGSYKPEDLAKYKAYKSVIEETNKLIQESVNDGITHSIPEAMKNSLKNDVFLFSAFKTHAQLFDASRLLTNDDGSIRTFHEFQQAVETIYQDYNINYLDAERTFALTAAQQAANWIDIEENGDKYNLQYRTAMDEKVRTQHQAMEGITLPAADDFWSMYYPPNGWRCRCVAVQVNKGKYEQSDSSKAIEAGEAATTKINSAGKNTLEIFRFNPGRDKVIFPPHHPYYKLKDAGVVKDLFSDKNDYIPKSIHEYERELGIQVNKDIFSNLKKEVPLMTSGNKGAYFEPSEGFVVIPFDQTRRQSKWKAESVVYHEYGHAIDWQNGIRFKSEVANLMKKYRELYAANDNELFKSLDKICWQKGSNFYSGNEFDEMHQIGALDDTIMSLNPNFGRGHKREYWDTKWYSEAEFIAHSFENYYIGNKQFKEIAPELYDDMIKLIDEVLK